MAERAARRIGLRRVPRIVMLPVRIAPLVWSLSGRPRVVLPAALFDRLDRAAQGAILAHELAHVRRKDHWVRLLELLVVTLFWWHPVAWWACRQLRELEEQCCDGMVLGTGRHDSRAYAIALLDTLEFLSESSLAAPLGATAAEPTISLARRIKMLRNSSTVTRLTLGRLLLLAALAAAPMALAFAVEPPEMKEPSRLAAEKPSVEAAPKTGGIDLSYVPSTAQAFVAIRPAEMLKSAELPDLSVLIQERCGPTFGKLQLPVDKVAQSLEAALKLAGAMGGMYRNPVEASPEPIRGHYVKLLDDYLDLLKQTTVAQEGEIVRTESTIDPAVVRNVLQLLAAARLLEAQHGEPSSEERADSSKAANVLTAQQLVLRTVNGQEVKVVGGDGQTVQLVMKESDVLTRRKSYNSNRKGR